MTVIARTLPSLYRARAYPLALLGLFLAGVGAGFLPLLEVPGYELAELASLLSVLLLAPWLGLRAALGELATSEPSLLRAFASASAATAILWSALFLGSLVRASFGPCRPLAEALYFPVLAGPSTLLAVSIAVALSFATGARPLFTRVLYFAAVLAILAFRLSRAYLGPEAFLEDPLLGYLPGPLYDEAIPLGAGLLFARLEAVGYATLVAGLCGLLLPLGKRRPQRRAALVTFALSLLLVGAMVLSPLAPKSGPVLRAEVERELGARREGTRCTVYLPSELPSDTKAEYLSECEFHAADVAALLGIASPPHLFVHVYRNPEEKRRLVGAARTDYTKPWLAEIEINALPLPHPVLRHEIVHAVAGALARPPLRVPTTFGIIPSLALVEGLAVALETPQGGVTVDEWSRAARDLGRLPDLSQILGPAGFWRESEARAYTAAGSFLAYLLARYGPAPIAKAYRDGDLERAFERPLAALVSEWQRSLDELPPREDLVAEARARFQRGSLFDSRCARQRALELRQAETFLSLGRTEEACEIYAREAKLSERALFLEREGNARASAGELDLAMAAYRAAEESLAPEELARRAELEGAMGDVLWRKGDLFGGLHGFEVARARPLSRSEARLLEVKLLAVRDPVLGPSVRDYLLGRGEPLALARATRTGHPLADYLLGRALLQAGQRGAAASALRRAAQAPLPPLVSLEARLSLAEASCDSGDDPLLLESSFALGADRARLLESRRRCAFLASKVPESTSPPR